MPEHTVKFKFNIDDKVFDPFGNICIIDSCSLNCHKANMYYVYSKNIARWLQEDQLKEYKPGFEGVSQAGV